MILIIIIILIVLAVLYLFSLSGKSTSTTTSTSEQSLLEQHDHNYEEHEHKADALLLSCIDYRLVDSTVQFINGTGLKDRFDYFILAGAGLSVAGDHKHGEFADWDRVYFQHVELANKLHKINQIILVEHMDCGAYQLVFGSDITADFEYQKHLETINRFKQLINQKYPTLGFRAYIMHLDGFAEKVY